MDKIERSLFYEVQRKKTGDFVCNLVTGKLALAFPAKRENPPFCGGGFSFSRKPNRPVQQLRTVEELRSLMVLSSNSSQLCSSCSRW